MDPVQVLPNPNPRAVSGLALVKALGEDRSWWLKKHQKEIQDKLDNAEPIFDIEVDAMMAQYADDIGFMARRERAVQTTQN